MRRIANRIEKLEKSVITQKSDLPDETKEMLAVLLGRLEALFYPQRARSSDSTPEIRRLQREYLNGSSGVLAKAEGKADWKDAHYTRKALVKNGLAIAVGAEQTKTLILTQDGEAHARNLTGMNPEGIEMFYHWQDAFRDLPGVVGDGGIKWIPEFVLFNVYPPGRSSRDYFRDESILQYLCAGIIDSQCDTVGRMYYRWLGVTPPEFITRSELKFSQRFEDLYFQAFNTELTRLAKLVCTDGGIWIPLSQSWMNFGKDMNNLLPADQWPGQAGYKPWHPWIERIESK